MSYIRSSGRKSERRVRRVRSAHRSNTWIWQPLSKSHKQCRARSSLEKLIDTLMRTAIEHAGAERGLLILPRGVEQRIEAEAITSGDSIIVSLREASVADVSLPESIVHYVVRTQESVILDDASARNPFSTDSYIRQHHSPVQFSACR